jgi:hypothetical protein
MADKIDIEILDDGTLKISTDKVSMPNHAGAEALIREMVKAMGGEVKRTKKSGQLHEHDGHFHQH